MQNVCLVATQSFNEGVWTPETRDKALKSMVLCISRIREFWPKTEAKLWGLYTSFYGIVQTNEIKSNFGVDERVFHQILFKHWEMG